jgi:hypothetical protein
MKKSDTSEQVISRRKALGRIGLFATAAYTVPAFATLSMAHASSGASGSSDSSGSSDPSITSDPSVASEASVASDPSVASAASPASGPSAPSPSDVEKACGVENLDADTPEGADYAECLITNGWEGFVQPLS